MERKWNLFKEKYQVPYSLGQRRGLKRFETAPSSFSLELEELNIGKGSETIRAATTTAKCDYLRELRMKNIDGFPRNHASL